MANKHYPQQFKTNTITLYRTRPRATIASIADDPGVNRETLRSWVRADDQRRGTGPIRPAAVAGEGSGSVEKENADLRRRVRELEEERDILRKAARYFAGETRPPCRGRPRPGCPIAWFRPETPGAPAPRESSKQIHGSRRARPYASRCDPPLLPGRLPGGS
jgi:transposase